jgi:signal transduction histidine kinase
VGHHGVVSARVRAGRVAQRAISSRAFERWRSPAVALQNWPVSRRLISVIVMALVMGLVFGGLRVAAAAGSAAQFGRVTQLASLGQQVTGLVQALQDERDETAGIIPVTSPKNLQRWYSATDAQAAKVQAQAAGIGGSFPGNIQASAAAVRSVISHLATLRDTAQASQSALAVIADYAGPIGDMITLNDQIAEGTADSVLTNDVRTLNSLSLEKDQAAQQRALLFNAFSQQIFADGEQQALTTAVSAQAADHTAFQTTATPAEQRLFTRTVAGPGVNKAELIEEYVLSVGSLDISALNIGPAQAPEQWYAAMSDTIGAMQSVELGVARNILARSQVLQRGAEQSALVTAILTALILLLVLGATLAVARSLVLPLRRLRAGALDIATVQLPERVRHLGEAADPGKNLDVAPIDVLSADEIGQVARAFDQVHSEAVRLAGNEAVLRSSFNALFVNLSRRSQSLIERLARMIDSLEQNEEDPDRLSDLFTIDHMVTRMRRNSENLLLLAGHESTRRWSEPVPIADVARAAASEIEQYSRVALNIQPGVAVSGHAVSDIVRLLAELLENATIFSSKDSQVRLSAQELVNGGVLIEVTDSGVGVSYTRLAEMNRRLDEPPVIDPAVARHMGLFAVAHLAARHKVRVRLRASSPHGLTALVWLPGSLITRDTRLSAGSPAGRAQGPAMPAGPQGLAMPAGPQGLAMPTRAQGPAMPTRAQGPAMPAGARARADTPAPAVAGGQPSSDAVDDPPDAATVPTPIVPAVPEPAASELTVPEPSVPEPTVPEPAAPGPQPAEPAPSAAGPRPTERAAGPAASNWFRSHRPSAADPAGDGPRPFGTGPWAEGRQAAQIIAEPVRSERTVAGMPVRVPRANLIPGSVGGGRPADGRGTSRPEQRHHAPPPAHIHQAPAPGAPPPQQQSPDLARSRLSGFQRGARRAQGQPPRTEEGADR